MTLLAPSADLRSPRTLLTISLALNLFLMGVVGALGIRLYGLREPPAAAEPDRTPAGRIERIVAPLPAADAAWLRAAYRAHAPEIEAAYDKFRYSTDLVRNAIRSEPYEIGPVQQAMADARSARMVFGERMHEVIAAAAAGMSPEGRAKLAEKGSSAQRRPAPAR